MRINAIFEGGGILGISFIGAYKALSDRGCIIDKCMGISSGAIVSSLITSGFSSCELIRLCNETDFKLFLSKTDLSDTSIIGKPISLLYHKGIYNSLIIEKWIKELLERKGVKKFKDIKDEKLKIIAANITKQKRIVLPDDLIKYNINPLEFSVARAVRMSCAIPFFYTPVKLESNNKNNYIVDGGIIKNLPSTLLYNKAYFNWPIYRFRIKNDNSYLRGIKDNLFFKKDEYFNENIITIQNKTNIKATNFHINKTDAKLLFKQGYQSTISYLDKD